MLINYRNHNYTLSPKNQNSKIYDWKNYLSIVCQYFVLFECVKNYKKMINDGKPKEIRLLDSRIELNSCWRNFYSL